MRVPDRLETAPEPVERERPREAHRLPALQQSIGNAALTRAVAQREETATAEVEPAFDMDRAIAANWKRYVKNARFVERAGWVVGAPLHEWFPRTPEKPHEKAFTGKLAEWQGSNGLDVTGELDEAAIAELEKAMDDTLEERMQERDVEELAEAVAAGSAARDEGEEAARSAIVSLALGEVGKVLDTDRGDGKKVGAERLRTYYRETVPDYSPEVYDKGIDTPGRFPGGTRAKEQRGAWSWCGIYATTPEQFEADLAAWRGRMKRGKGG